MRSQVPCGTCVFLTVPPGPAVRGLMFVHWRTPSLHPQTRQSLRPFSSCLDSLYRLLVPSAEARGCAPGPRCRCTSLLPRGPGGDRSPALAPCQAPAWPRAPPGQAERAGRHLRSPAPGIRNALAHGFLPLWSPALPSSSLSLRPQLGGHCGPLAYLFPEPAQETPTCLEHLQLPSCTVVWC